MKRQKGYEVFILAISEMV